MKEMAQKWADASGGKVKLRIYPGGVLGNEGAMVQKMRVGQLSAAALTTVGLHDITPEPQAVDVPMGIASWDELDYVMERIGPKLEKILEDKGYVVIQWSDVGFVQFFSTKALHTPKEFADEAKLFAWEGDPASTEAWRAGGFHPVVLASTDVIPALQTGMIDTIASAPLYSLTSRIYQKANHMLDLRWAVLNGATVVKRDVWEKIPADLRPKLLEISRAAGRKIALDVRKMNEDAIATMKSQGLIEEKTGDLPGWYAASERANKIVRGKVVPAAIFDEVMKLRDEYRAKHK
jgi:TRAP-type C4-dicarboxylate transport system substrate-binding protein